MFIILFFFTHFLLVVSDSDAFFNFFIGDEFENAPKHCNLTSSFNIALHEELDSSLMSTHYLNISSVDESNFYQLQRHSHGDYLKNWSIAHFIVVRLVTFHNSIFLLLYFYESCWLLIEEVPELYEKSIHIASMCRTFKP